MATVGQLPVLKLVPVGCSRRSPHSFYPDDNQNFRAPYASFSPENSLAILTKGEYRHKNCQSVWSSSKRSCKRQSFASGAVPGYSASGSSNNGIDVDGYRSKLEALLYCGKSIPEENIGKPAGLPAKALPVGNKPKCFVCEAKGAVECATCAGTGLYVDAVLESQGIIVRVRCLGCGGSGSIMCSKCWGRGHV